MVARLDSLPATEPPASLTVEEVALGAGVATIECVGTIESLRGRGIGTAMTLASLLESRRCGFRVAALLSSATGRGLYERLGFRACGTFKFVRGPAPASE